MDTVRNNNSSYCIVLRIVYYSAFIFVCRVAYNLQIGLTELSLSAVNNEYGYETIEVI